MVVEPAEGTPPKRGRAKREKKVTAAVLAPVAIAAEPTDSGGKMNDNLIVQFVGYEVNPIGREYRFTVREPTPSRANLPSRFPTSLQFAARPLPGRA